MANPLAKPLANRRFWPLERSTQALRPLFQDAV